jgi:hypothetical protein
MASPVSRDNRGELRRVDSNMVNLLFQKVLSPSSELMVSAVGMDAWLTT